jgi:hypothetical protein
MNYLILGSILKRQIYIGQSRLIVSALIPIALSICAAIALNIIYLKRYKRLLAYLEKFHPEIYERIRRKPDFGTFYSTGYNYIKPLTELTKQPEIQNNQTTKRMLTEFLNFDRKITWIGIIIGIIGLLLFSMISIISLY